MDRHRFASSAEVRRRWAARALYVLLALALLGLWANIVRRAAADSSTDFVDFLDLSRFVVHGDEGALDRYGPGFQVDKYPPFFAIFFAPLGPLPIVLDASMWFLLNAGLATVRVLRWSLFLSFVLMSTAVSRLAQAFSTPFLAAFVLAAALVFVLRHRGSGADLKGPLRRGNIGLPGARSSGVVRRSSSRGP